MSVLLRIKEAPLLRKLSAAARQEGCWEGQSSFEFSLSRLWQKNVHAPIRKLFTVILVPFKFFKQQHFFLIFSGTPVKECR